MSLIKNSAEYEEHFGINQGMEDPMIDRAGDEDVPQVDETDNEGERQDTPPLPTTHEEVLQNLSKHPEAVSKNEVERMATEAGVDFDSDTVDKFNIEVNNN